MPDGTQRIVVCSDPPDSGSVTELQILAQQLLLDAAYLSNVVDDMKLSFTPMEVLELIWYQFFIPGCASLLHPSSFNLLLPKL